MCDNSPKAQQSAACCVVAMLSLPLCGRRASSIGWPSFQVCVCVCKAVCVCVSVSSVNFTYVGVGRRVSVSVT